MADVERRRLAEEHRHLLRERGRQVAELLPRLEPPDQLGSGPDADVRVDQRLLEALPRRVVERVERRDRELLCQRTARLAERLAQPAEQAALRLLRLDGRIRVAQ